jgi:hypothetical protein
MGIQRWSGLGFEVCLPDAEGNLVLFTDHERVVAELSASVERACDLASGYLGRIRDLNEEVDRLRAGLAAKSKDAERWQYARKLLNVEDILQRQVELAAWNYLVSEVECDRADKAIDQAMGDGNGR